MSNVRNNNLDLMRFLAAALVLFSHCYPLTARGGEPFARVMGYESGGGLAVAVFFVISGYLVTPSYLRSKNVFAYIWKRVFRIFPGLIVAVVLTFLLCSLVSTHGVQGYFTNGATFGYLKNAVLDIQFYLPGVFVDNAYPNTVNGSLWTLPIETCMYVVVLVLGLAWSLKPYRVMAATVAAFAIYIAAWMNHGLGQIVVLGVAHFVDVAKLAVFFMMGATLHFHVEKHQVKALPALIAALLWVGTFRTEIGVFVYMLTLPYLVIYISKINLPGLRHFGKHGDISYGMYIYAFPIEQAIVHYMGNGVSVGVLFVKGMAFTIPVAICSWLLVEKPALNYIHARVSKHHETSPPAVAEAGT